MKTAMISYQEQRRHWKNIFFWINHRLESPHMNHRGRKFKSIFCLPWLIFMVCLMDTFIPKGTKLRDPRRLYAPGRMYHIVERKFCRCGRYPPEVRTAIHVDGRSEYIVLSSHVTSDHAIIWILREA